MELEEAIQILNEIQESNRTWMLQTTEKNCEKLYLRDIEAIETVLKELETLKEKELDYTTVYMNGVYDEQAKWKKKIEKYLAEETEKYKVYKKEADKNENLKGYLWHHMGAKNMCEKILDIEKKVTLD